MPIVFTIACPRCGRSSRLALLDIDVVGVETGKGAGWSCPRCEVVNRLPAVGIVMSVVPL